MNRKILPKLPMEPLTRFYLIIFFVVPFHVMHWAQQNSANPPTNLLNGAIDFHIHPAPDIVARSLTDIEAARVARDNGMRAIIIKNHVNSTAARAELVNSMVEGIDVYGGITLNHAVGGLNPSAVRVMTQMSPDYGKVVWMPTRDAAHAKSDGTGISISQHQKLAQPVVEILQIILDHKLVLATGHLSPQEILLLVEKANEMGIEKILITHPLANPPGVSREEMKKLITLGCKLELTYLSSLLSASSNISSSEKREIVQIKEMMNLIQDLGSEHFILTSDLGQPGNPLPTDGFRQFIAKLLDAGVHREEIKQMIITNPSRLLGIEE